MIEKTLKELLEAKKNLWFAQRVFKLSQVKTYPYLEKEELSNLDNEISVELDTLLSATLTIKSARILIPHKGGFQQNLVLTRSPGLKAVYSCNKDFNLMQENYQLKNGNLVKINQEERPPKKLKEGEKKMECMIKLSVLKSHQHIKQDILKKFYEFLEKCQAWNLKALEDFEFKYSYSADEDKEKFSETGFRIKTESKNYKILIRTNSKLSWKNYLEYDSEYFSDYERSYDFNEEELKNLDGAWENSELKKEFKILKLFSEIKIELDRKEAIKKMLFELGHNLLKQLKIETRGFRFLKKIDG